MKILAPIDELKDIVSKEYVDGKFLSGLSINGDKLQYTLNGANTQLTIPYASNANKLGGTTLSGLFTALTSNATNAISITVGGTTKNITPTTLKNSLALNNVENTKLSTWTGTDNITTLGTITSGTWNGTKIANDYIANPKVTINGTDVNLGGIFTTASITAGTAGTSSATSGYTLSVPYVTMNKYGVVTAYGTHTHTIKNIPNSSLVSSSITIAGTNVSLGGDISKTTLQSKLDIVTISGEQDVSGAKTFSSLITADGGISVKAGQALTFYDAKGNAHSISFDSENGAFHFDTAVYSDGSVSALGKSNSEGGSGVNIDWLNFPSNLIPDASNTRYLGSSSKPWYTLYTTNVECPDNDLNLNANGYIYMLTDVKFGAAGMYSIDSPSGVAYLADIYSNGQLVATQPWVSGMFTPITTHDALVARVTSLEGGSALSVETTGSGNAITAISKSGTKITATKDTTFVTSNTNQVITGHKTIATGNTGSYFYFRPQYSTDRQAMIVVGYGSSSSAIEQTQMSFYEYSFERGATSHNGYYEVFRLPSVDVGRTSSAAYDIYTSKNFIAGTNYISPSGLTSALSSYLNTSNYTTYTPIINGSHATKDTSIYAPTSAGTNGYVLKSSGGTPAWVAQSSLNVGYIKDYTVSSNVASGMLTGKNVTLSDTSGATWYVKITCGYWNTVESIFDVRTTYNDRNNGVIFTLNGLNKLRYRTTYYNYWNLLGFGFVYSGGYSYIYLKLNGYYADETHYASCSVSTSSRSDNIVVEKVTEADVAGITWTSLETNVSYTDGTIYANRFIGSFVGSLEGSATSATYLKPNSTKNLGLEGTLQLYHSGHVYGNELDEWNSPFGVYTNSSGVQTDYGTVLRVRYNSKYYTDFWIDANLSNEATIAYRRIYNNNVDNWIRILTSRNFATYLNSSYVKKSGDTMTGQLSFSGTTYPHIYGNGNYLILAGSNETAKAVIVEKNGFRPYVNNAMPLGISGNRWSNIYSVKGDFSGQITSSVADGTAPFVVASKTEVANLHSATATKLHTPRTIALNGAVTGTATSFDGSANIAIPTTGVNAYYVSGYMSENADVYYGHHPERKGIIPFIYNDLAHLISRGGTCTIYKTTDTDYTQPTLTNVETIGGDYTNVFDGSPSYFNHTVSALTDVVVVDIVCPATYTDTNKIYIDFGNTNWRAKDIYVYIWNNKETNSERVYKLVGSVTDNTRGAYYISTSYAYTDTSGNSQKGFNCLRIVLTNFPYTTNRRIAQIGVICYNSIGLRNTYMSRGIDDRLYRSITPDKSSTYNLGSSTYKWNDVYANKFYGDITFTTPRTIWGQSFDGSADVSGALSGVTSITGASSSSLLIHSSGSQPIGLAYNGDETKAVVLNSAQFKPYDTANLNLDLGTTSARWKGIYGYTLDLTAHAFVDGNVLTGGKTAVADGVAGCVLHQDGNLYLVSSTPSIKFYYNNATSETSRISEVDSGKLTIGTGTYANAAYAFGDKLNIATPGPTTDNPLRIALNVVSYIDNYSEVGTGIRIGATNSARAAKIYYIAESTWGNTGGIAFYNNEDPSTCSEKLRLTHLGNLIPKYNTSTQSLGSSGARWVAYLNSADVSGDATVGGTLTSGTLLPTTNGTYYLGRTDRRWHTGYFTGAINIGAANSGIATGASNTTIGTGYIELSYSTPLIDFHYNNSTTDYTNRIIEGLSGQLTVTGKLRVGLSYNTSTDYNLHVVGTAYASTSITTPTATITNANITTLRRIQSAASTAPTMWVSSANYDNTILRVDYSQKNTYLGDYGFSLKYMGTGGSVQNNLNLYADNQQASTQVVAWSVNQNGQVAIRTTATNTAYDLYVNSTAYIPTLTTATANVTTLKIGNATITWDGEALKFDKPIYSTGSVSALGIGTTEGGTGSVDLLSVPSNIIASTTGYNLGSSAIPWSKVYSNTVYANDIYANSGQDLTLNGDYIRTATDLVFGTSSDTYYIDTYGRAWLNTIYTNGQEVATQNYVIANISNVTDKLVGLESSIGLLETSTFTGAYDGNNNYVLTWFTASGGGRNVTLPTYSDSAESGLSDYDGKPCLMDSYFVDDIKTWVQNQGYLTSIGSATTSTLGLLKVSNKLTTAVTLTSGNGTTASRYYGVQMDSNGVAFVNVPWTNTVVSVMNSLTSTSTTAALSANQGKVLKDYHDALDSRVTTLEGAGYITSSALSGYAKTSDLLLTSERSPDSFSLRFSTNGGSSYSSVGMNVVESIDDVPTAPSLVTELFIADILDIRTLAENAVTKTGTDTITGAKTFSGTSATMLTIDRNSTNPALIRFMKNGSTLGYLGVDNNKNAVFNNGNSVYYLTHNGNIASQLSSMSLEFNNTVTFNDCTTFTNDVFVNAPFYIENQGMSGREDGNDTWYIDSSGDAIFEYLTCTNLDQSSDMTKKNRLHDVELSLMDIANAPAFHFLWKNGKNSRGMQVGTSAQYWQTVLPEVVSGTEGSLTMNYSVLGVVSSILIAREVVDTKDRVARLEERVKALEAENEELRKLIA